MLKRSRLLLCGFLLARSGQGFDTGHHRDMTRNALMREGFGQQAIEIVVLQNWLTDFYAGQENVSIKALFAETPDLAAIDEAEWVHFDNLVNTGPVRTYWNTLIQSTAAQMYRRMQSKADDPLAILTLLGISLHAVQDFYTHSTWIEAHHPSPGSPFLALTWMDAEARQLLPQDPIRTGIYPDKNGPRGFRHADLNKDSYERENWDRSYALAYIATRQWVRGFRAFVEANKPGFWARCIQDARITGPELDTLTTGLDASYKVSEVLGKWKGSGSSGGDVARMMDPYYQFKKTVSGYKLAFIKQAILFELSNDLHNAVTMPNPRVLRPLPTGVPLPHFDPVPLDETAVVLSMPMVKSTNSPNDPFDEVNDHSMYARSTFQFSGSGDFSQEFVDATQLFNSGRKPFKWQVIWFVPNIVTDVAIHIELWNEGASSPAEDHRIDISGSPIDPTVGLHYLLDTHQCRINNQTRPCDRNNMVTVQGQIPPRGQMSFSVETQMLARP